MLTINTICPIEYANIAKHIAFIHMTTVESAVHDEESTMLPTNLGPIDNDQITHVFCARSNCGQDQVDLELQTLSEQKLEWISGEILKITDTDFIKSHFCCFVGETQDLLNALELKIK